MSRNLEARIHSSGITTPIAKSLIKALKSGQNETATFRAVQCNRESRSHNCQGGVCSLSNWKPVRPQ